MHPISLSVKENVPASAQNLATSAFLFFYREQMSTQVALSAGIQVYRIVTKMLMVIGERLDDIPIEGLTNPGSRIAYANGMC